MLLHSSAIAVDDRGGDEDRREEGATFVLAGDERLLMSRDGGLFEKPVYTERKNWE